MSDQNHSLDALAIFGGDAPLTEPLCVGRPNEGERNQFFELVGEILDRRRLTNNGPVVLAFEREVAEQLQVAHCVATCSATLGLQLLFHALDLEGEVIMPAFTFIATPHSAKWTGLTPIFCDVDELTHCIDAASIEPLISPATSAILGVHLWGRACDVTSLTEIAERHGLPLLFDAAHAFGCEHDGKRIGGFGRAEVFSFHATKLIHTLEGGVVATNDGELAKRLRQMRNHGLSEQGRVEALGTNAKMNEISAAMGLVMLRQRERLVEHALTNFRTYRTHLAGVPGIGMLQCTSDMLGSGQFIVLMIDEATTGVSRDVLAEVLVAENVLAQKYFSPGCHKVPPYNHRDWHLPVTDELCRRCLILPTGETVGGPQIGHIASVIRRVVAGAEDVRRRLARRASTVASETRSS